MPPTNVAFLYGMLCGYFIGFCIGCLFGAAVLKVAVAFYNKMAGGERSDRGVPSPSFGKAFIIMFLTSSLNLVLAFGLIIAAEKGAGSGGMRVISSHRQVVSVLVSQAIWYPLAMIVLTGMISSILPTNLGRAFLVTLCHVLIVVLLVVALMGVMIVCLGTGGVR